MEDIFMPGHRVEYTYTHYTNSTTYFERTKKGTLIRAIRDKKNLYRPTEFWMVRIDGNKSLSKISEKKLKNITLNP